MTSHARAADPLAVRVEGIIKRYRVRRTWPQMLRRPRGGEKVTVLDGIDLRIEPGEFFGILGPNGAGKTTLFKILATLIVPDDGVARVHGLDVVHEAGAVRATLAPVIADERSLYWRLTAAGNLELFAALYGWTGEDARRRVADLLERVGLSDAGTKLVGEFSSGMKQRLLLARALLAEPRVLLLDEPTRSLDPISARAFRAFLRERIAGELGCTIVLATHNSEEALELCTRVAVLNRGRLLAVGAASELQARYGEDRYRAWVREGSLDRIRQLAGRSPISRIGDESRREAGWEVVDLDVPGGLEQAAGALAAIRETGAEVAKFEHLPLSLADLMERIVGNGGAP